MLVFCFSGFVAFGVVLVLLGANQADLARDLGLDLARTGTLASGLALGIALGVVCAGPLFDRFPRRRLFVGSMLVAGAGLVSVDASMGFGRAFAHTVVFGFGCGCYDTLINAAVVERYREHANRPMVLVHSGATVGAMLGPFAIGWLAARGHWTASFQWVGAAHLALALWACAVPFPRPVQAGASGPPLRSVLSLALVPLALMSFAYVGAETALTLFAVPYATDALALPEASGRHAISAFWFGLLFGRLGVLALPRAGAREIAAAGIVAATLIAAGVASGTDWLRLVLAAIGVALGSVYPLMIVIAGQRFPHAMGTAAGLVAGAGGAGAMVVPPLTGALGDGAGVAIGFGSVSLWSLLIAASAFFVLRRSR